MYITVSNVNLRKIEWIFHTFSQNWHSKLSPPDDNIAGVAFDCALHNGVASHMSSSRFVSTLNNDEILGIWKTYCNPFNLKKLLLIDSKIRYELILTHIGLQNFPIGITCMHRCKNPSIGHTFPILYPKHHFYWVPWSFLTSYSCLHGKHRS